MKKIILLTMLLLQSVAIKLYAQNWSNWVTLSNNKGISASVSFLIRNGKSGGISFWKSNNNTYVKGGALFFSFDYIDDKGNPQTETTTTMIDLSKTGEVKDEGRSFVCNGGSITNIKVTSIYLPNDNTATNTNSVSTNSNSTSSNNSYNNNNNSSNRPLNFGTPQVNNSSNNSTYNHNQAVMNKLNNQLQTSQNVYNAVTGVLQQLQQQQEEKAQREEQEREKQQQEKKEEQEQENWNNGYTQLSRAVDFLKQGNYTDALYWFQQSANRDNTDAQYDLGVMYKKGDGVTQNYIQAMQWFQRAANNDNAKAQYALGTMYGNGEGVVKDITEALQWWQKAANKGDANAQLQLGFLYEAGGVLPQDYAQAMQWFQKAVAQGNTDAQGNIGLMYEYGYGVPPNKNKAIEWFRKAATNGAQFAKEELKRLGVQE